MWVSLALSSFDLENKKRKGSTNALEKSFYKTSQYQLDALIARMFYFVGLSFHLVRNLHVIGIFTYAANDLLSGYEQDMCFLDLICWRQVFFQREKANIERLLVPMQGEWHNKRVSIGSDGWSYSQRRSLINFKTIFYGGLFVRSKINTSLQIWWKKWLLKLDMRMLFKW